MAFAQVPPPAPAPVYNWTGWYAGVNVGASFGTDKTDFNNAPFINTGSPGHTISVFAGQGLGSDTLYTGGFVGGGQVGYNWQFSPIWVVGLEADIQGTTEKDSTSVSTPFNETSLFQVGIILPSTVIGTALTDYTAKIEWFGTARLRAGYVWGNGDVFSYVTGGFAYGKVDVEGTNTVSGAENVVIPFSLTNAFGHSQVNTGWVVGSGTEGKLLIPGWTYKIEALYMDLGHLDTTGVTTSASSFTNVTGTFTFSGGQVTTHTHFTDTILRLGVNYQFH